MTEEQIGQPAEGGEQVGSLEEEPQGGNELNPAWNDLLGVVPEDLHGQVTPLLQQWDQNYDKVQSTYAPYKPFVENQIPAENIDFALGVMQQIEQDPMGVINSLTQYAKENGLWQDAAPAQTPSDQGQVDDDELSQHPRFQQMQQQLEEMQQFVQTFGQQYLTEQQRAQQEQEDAELNTTLEELTKELGEFDVEWVLNRAVQAAEAGGNAEDLRPFVEQYREYEKSILARHNRPAPKLMPSGGQAPNSQVDMRQLTPEARTKLIAERIAAANQSQ